MTLLDDRLTQLAAMPLARLREEWARVHRAPVPPMTADLLRRGIAYALQERELGALPSSVTREIDRLCRDFARTGGVTATPPLTIKPGTRLVRDWGGVTHHVLVLEGGYMYGERRYRSLSQIASNITGVRWSGPRFFGLIRKPASNA